VSKTCERQEQARKKKTTKKQEESGDSERLKPPSSDLNDAHSSPQVVFNI